MGPLIIAKIEPKRKCDLELLRFALQDITQADNDASLAIDPVSNELILGGMSEMHIDGILNLLHLRNIDFCAGAPQISYLETLYGAAEVDYAQNRKFETHCELVRIRLRVAPNKKTNGNTLASEISNSAAFQDHTEAIEKGIQSVLVSGPLLGFPMVDVEVTLLDVSTDDANTTVTEFETASSKAMRKACVKAKVKLLEPIMDVEVVVPEEFIGPVIGDFNSRRGWIRSQETHGPTTIVRASVPLASMFGYSITLPSITSGRASFTMGFNCYDEVPRNITSPDPDNFPPAIGMRA